MIAVVFLIPLASLMSGDWFGYSVASIGDINADGVCDLAVGDPGHGSELVLLSGVDGRALSRVSLDGYRVGWELAYAKDGDGPGYLYTIASESWDQSPAILLAVNLASFDFVMRAKVRPMDLPARLRRPSTADLRIAPRCPLQVVADQNEDGVSDVLYGSGILCGQTGSLIRRLWANDERTDLQYGVAVSNVGDLRIMAVSDGRVSVVGDQVMELVSFQRVWTVRLFSLGDIDSDGEAEFGVARMPDGDVANDALAGGLGLFEVRDLKGEVRFSYSDSGRVAGSITGDCAVAMGDVTGDGFCEIAVAAESLGVVLLSGEDGEVVWNIEGRHDYYTRSLSAMDDVDGDGVGDVAVGEYRTLPSGGPRGSGVVYLVGGKTGKLIFSTTKPKRGK